MSYGCGNDQTTPIDTHMISNDHPVAWKSHSKFQSGWSFDQFLIAKITSSLCGDRPHPLPHPHVVNTFPGTCRQHTKFFPDQSD